MKKHNDESRESAKQNVLARYLNGTCTEEEQTLVEQWYNLKASGNGVLPDGTDFQKLKQEIWNNIDKRETVVSTLRYKLAGIAASVILLVAVGGALLNPGLFKKQGATWVNVKAPEGKVIKVELPDGSKVWLNAGSTMSYMPSFGKDAVRTVRLNDGEAYFDVAHDARKPFVVLTGKIKTQVLGTSFNIQAAAELKKITVTVLNGKVGVIKNSDAPLFLLPNEQAEFNKETGEIGKLKVTAENTTGWIAGKFRFHNQELEAITSELRRRYHVGFIFKTENLRSIRFNTGFNATDRLSDVLNDLAKTGNIKFNILANQVTVSQTNKSIHY